MVSALYSNPNWDDASNDRTARIKDLNKHYNEAIEQIYHPERFQGVEIDWDNPFWQAHQRSVQRTRERYGLANHDITMRDVIDSEAQDAEKLREFERRAAMRGAVDQLSMN